MQSEKPHQIFYLQRNYDSIINTYRRQQKKQYTNEQLLILAKAYFLNEEYDKCIDTLANVNPAFSTKVLYERQSLLFRAIYLLKRHQPPLSKDLTQLNQIVEQFNRLKTKAPGEEFKKHHLEKMQSYKKFISFLQSYAKSIVTYNEKLTAEIQKDDKSTHKLTGFPCYLVAEQWLNDFEKMKKHLQLKTDKTYLGPLTNFALINDIFETHFYQSQFENYKNTYIFPINKYKLVSKKLWAFYCGIFSPEAEFFPIKRLFQERTYRQYYANSNNSIVQLIPVVVECQNRRTVYNLSANELISRELIPLIQLRYGPGELKTVSNEDASFELFYFGEKAQKALADFGKILVYHPKKLPDHLKQINIFNHLQYNPIPPTALLSKEGGLRGLQNLGNSCYLNSVVQCLSFTQQISKYLTTLDFSQVMLVKKEGDISVTLAFADLLKQLWRAGENKYVIPYKFKKYFGLRNTMFAQKTQEDAHEFLLHLLNSVHDDIKTGISKVPRSLSKLQVTTNVQEVKRYFQKHQLEQNKSLITKLMRGIYHTTILCKNCNTYSHSFDLFLALSVTVPYVSYPFIRFYYVPLKSRNTYKYELSLKGVKTINEVFVIFQKEVLDAKAEPKLELKLENGSSPTQKPESPKKNYLLIGFHKQKDPEQLWNSASSNQLTQKQLTVDQLLELKKDLIFYEVQVLPQEMKLVLVEYKYKQMFSGEKAIGIPKFLVLPQETIKATQANKFKKTIVQNNYEDRIYEQDFDNIKAYQYQTNNSIKYSLTGYFKRVEKMFLETNLIDKELNSTSDSYEIRDCLKQMSKPDTLEGWKCGHCNQSKVAEKVQHLTEISQILIISLKRFQANGNKIKNMIQYPLQGLDMKEWLQDKNGMGNYLYDLYGVCFHSGTMQYGHYRAYCKHFVTGEWFEFDDERVKKVQPNDVITSQAYMLFYKRRQI